MIVNNLTFVNIALQLLSNGYIPLPIRHNEKRPSIAGWQLLHLPQQLRSKENIGDPDINYTITSEWIHAQDWSGGIGVSCSDNLVIIDIDDPALISAVRTALPPTVERTGRPERTALIYRTLEPMQSLKLPGVDVLAVGRQSVLPPTVHPETGQPYIWLSGRTLLDTTISELPVFGRTMLDMLATITGGIIQKQQYDIRSGAHHAPATSDEITFNRSQYVAYAQKALENECTDLARITVGSRNHALRDASMRMARFVHGGVLPVETMRVRLLEACGHNGVLQDDGERQCDRTVTQGLMYGKQRPLEKLNDPAVLFRDHPATLPKGALSAQVRPVVRIREAHLSSITEDCEQHLIDAKVDIYAQPGRLVRPILDEMRSFGNRSAKVPRVVPVDVVYLHNQIAKTCQFQRFDMRAKAWFDTKPSKYFAETIMASDGEWKFRKLTAVTGAAAYLPGGRIVDQPGYDEESGIFVLDPPQMPAIPEIPTREDALRALALLDELLEEFPFVNAESYSVGLSHLMTGVLRTAMNVAPAHAVSAHTAGTGKSFLQNLASYMMTGDASPFMTWPGNEEEGEKRLDANMLSGVPIIAIDNVNGAIGGNRLCHVADSVKMLVRPLGSSQKIAVGNTWVLCVNGNNITIIGDLCRRVIMAQLDARVERPERRRFRKNPRTMILNDRGKYIAAVFTIARAYHAAGYPEATRLSPLESFEEWSQLVRDPLVWLGRADPVESQKFVIEKDPERDRLIQFMHALSRAPKPLRASEIVGIVKSPMPSEIKTAVEEFLPANLITPRSLGKWLMARQGKPEQGMSIELKTDRDKFSLWYIKKLT